MSKIDTSFELVIVIPCYNEENRLPISQFKDFLTAQKNVLLCFVNDGSTDQTDAVVNQLKRDFNQYIHLLSLPKNVGKAGAVKEGMNVCNQNFDYQKIAYLDADLATSLEECYAISKEINKTVQFAFGSRIAKIDTQIQRKKFRFFVGRFIATLISMQLDLKVYDTQCGCKIFDKEVAHNVFQESFISKWLFDVEIFHRLITVFGKEKMANVCREVPLKVWIDTDDSKVKMSYFFKIWFDLVAIKKRYR